MPLRTNLYDGVLEYWVTIRERGEKKETTSWEERQSQKEKALCAFECICWVPQPPSALLDQGTPVGLPANSFKGIGAMEQRLAQDATIAEKSKEAGQYAQARIVLYIDPDAVIRSFLLALRWSRR